ncbi:MAG TPA: alpha-amylase, partial [Actinoplanes sp.]|nr:alpha-amylase [Actinoplanes sp.]
DRIEDPAYARTGVARDGCRQPMPWPATPMPVVTEAIRLRRSLPHGPADGEPVQWSVDLDSRLVARAGRFVLAVAMGTGPVPVPPGRVLLTSDPLTGDGRLPADAAAWVVTE